jgi:hypothetical protein
MGLFLEMVAVAAPAQAVTHALSELDGDLQPEEIIPCASGKALVMFGDGSESVSDVCKTLSKDLMSPTFYLHIHDGDLWMYEFFVGGEAVDRFNTTPDYWSDVDEEEEKRWQGDADLIEQHWPGAKAELIKRYLVNHSKAELDPEAKAYETDEFPFWDC